LLIDDIDGKAKRLNEIISLFSGDVLFLTDADVLPDDQMVISKMVDKFKNDPQVDMVLANVRPLPAITFFESAINNFFYAREDQAKNFDFLSSIHGARGAGLALSKKIAKKLIFPESLIIDDAFIYLFIKQNNCKVVSASDAVIWFRSVQTVNDFKKQMMRYMKGGEQLHKFYTDELILNTSFVPSSVMLQVLYNQLQRNFFGYIYLKMVFIYCRFYLRYYDYRTSPKWVISKSSKYLQVYSHVDHRVDFLNKLWKILGVVKGVLFVWLNN
jgi:cellulose synthase/poly-beta-1,6-N-acetylglucosamine synthase-like glycosyltransferase